MQNNFFKNTFQCQGELDVLGLTDNHYVDQIVEGQAKNWEAEAFHFLLNGKTTKVVKYKNVMIRFCRNSLWLQDGRGVRGGKD